MKGEKTGGRKPGSLNKTTADHREKINSFISKNWGKVQKDFNLMEPKDRLAFMEKLLRYTTPTLSAISAKVNYESLTDEDLEKIILALSR